jgi:tetratricopeptide (TPR) repeat protein
VLKAPGSSPRHRARALLAAGMVAQNDHAWHRSVIRLREAVTLFGRQGTSAGNAMSLLWLGRALNNLGGLETQAEHHAEASRCFEESRRQFVALGDLVGSAWCRIHLSTSAFWTGDLERAEALNRTVVAECTEAGVLHPVGQALSNLSYICHRQGQHAQAVAYMREAIARFRDIDDPWQLTDGLVDLALFEAEIGRGAAGLRALAESVILDDRIGRRPGRALKLGAAAYVHLARGDKGAATSAMGASLAHPPSPEALRRRPTSGAYLGWLADAIAAAQAQLDPAAVDAATADAAIKDVARLIEELILAPARVDEH